MENDNGYTGFEIAITGIACRFPGAKNWSEFWENLVNEKESVNFLSDEELLNLGVEETTFKNKNYVRVTSALKDKNNFDSAFFDYTPNEARLMNPEHRFFHECVWEALEDAGYDPDRVSGPIGLYAGAGVDVNWQVYSMFMNGAKNVDDFYLSKINNKDYLTSLVSYKLNLKGPSYYVHTACSTSLVAVHMACRALLFGETRIAIAGGVSISTWKQKGYMYQEGAILSKDGHCRPFDKNSSGTYGGDGAGVVVLKRLTDAINDGDHIYAVIKGSAINNDGKRKVGYTAPSVDGQVECLRMAQRVAKTEANTISYLETHGTATKLGDSIEIQALNTVFNKSGKKTCAIGAVKSNIGHLDSAAGVAGLIKAALCLKYKKIPATLHFKEPDPEIDFDGGPFYVNTQLNDWLAEEGTLLRAGVNSFGVGGSNAHVILEEFKPEEKSGDKERYKVLCLSAKTENSLSRYIESLKVFADNNSGINTDDLCYTLQAGRKQFICRKAIVFKSQNELRNKLESMHTKIPVSKSKNRKEAVVFMFPGQGSQYTALAKDLFTNNSFFREQMKSGFSFLNELTGEDFEKIIFPEGESDKINETQYTQPALFLIEYALAKLLMEYGISPSYMTGHSIGEYAAACISGVFSFKDALKIVVKRAKLMASARPGAMISVSIQEDRVNEFLNNEISLAAVNSKQQVVFSGETEAIEKLATLLRQYNIPGIKLRTSRAFHSEMLEPILPEFRKEFENITLNKPQIPFLSNLTGNLITEQEACSPDYWVQHMRKPVKFYQGIKTLSAINDDFVYAEVGPGNTLISLLKQHITDNVVTAVNFIRPSREKIDDEQYLLEGLAKLWSAGVAIDWNAVNGKHNNQKISLPTYSFEPTKYPTEVDPFENGLVLGSKEKNSATSIKDWIYYQTWKQEILTEPVVKKCKYLLVSPSEKFLISMRALLSEKENEVVCVNTGAGFSFTKINGETFKANISDKNNCELLVSNIKNLNIQFDSVIFCAEDLPARPDLIAETKQAEFLFSSFTNLIKCLSSVSKLNSTRFFIVTHELYDITGREEIKPHLSVLPVLGKIVFQEHGALCTNIDLDAYNEKNAVQLLAELNSPAKGSVVALRNKKRWVNEFQKNSNDIDLGSKGFRHEGVYLITGGLGNLGYVIARYLAENYKARLILTGRKKNPDGIYLERFNALQSKNSSLQYIACDVCKQEELEKTISEVQTKYGKIDGVFHLAGNVDRENSELLEKISSEKASAIFNAKTYGIQNLYTVFKNRDVDFIWAASSMASESGGIGLAAYAAANSYMNNFIGSVAEEKQVWKSVCLPKIDFDETSEKNTVQGSNASVKAEDLPALIEWSIAGSTEPVVYISLKPLSANAYLSAATEDENDLNENEAIEKTDRPELSSGYVPAVTETEKKLVAVFENLFGINGIGTEDNFFDLGGDSLKGMILIKRINTNFNMELSLNDLFTTSTVAEIAKLLQEKTEYAGDNATNNEIII
ncbi:MAG: SDR family NAD(P)-dependent oxidoreductase [Bacteroidia bacterium]|nr:SDR family NAD(P)-dependent oxidoreductase [Bacteroidia bacterium]